MSKSTNLINPVARPGDPNYGKLTDYICDACKEADKDKTTHPGVRHTSAICDCPCRRRGVTDEQPVRRDPAASA